MKEPMTFQEAATRLGSRDSRKIGNNTYLLWITADRIGIMLHNTVVVTLHRSGNVGLDSGGWRTVTTRARMNEYAPGISVVQRAFKWFVITDQGTREFEDKMIVDHQVLQPT